MEGEIFSVARGQLARASAWLAPLFYRLKPAPRPGLVRPGTDGARFLYDPEWLKADFEAGGSGLCAALAHSTVHCLLGHVFGRADGLAADMAVQLFLDDHLPQCCPCRGEGLFMEAKRRLNGLGPEGIRRAMAEEDFFLSNREALERLAAVDDHGLWRPGTAGSRAYGDSGGDLWAAARGRFAPRGGGGRRGVGLQPGDTVTRWRPVAAPSRDYGQLLRRYAVPREFLREDPDAFDPGLYAYGLRQYGDVPLIEPAETREARRLEELAVVIDTSGSCVRDLTARFLAETCALASDETLFPRRFNLRILQCDAQVRREDVVTCARDLERYAENLEIVGGGGTDFTPAFRRIDRLIELGAFRRLPCALFFTDGRGIYPRERPCYDVVFVCCRGRYDLIDAPPWVDRLILDMPD